MATEKYVPYKGFFGGSLQIDADLNWFDGAEELVFLWVFPSSAIQTMTMRAATNAGAVSVSGKTVSISRLKLDKESAECVFVYRSSALKTQAVELMGGIMPLSAILKELEEHRRSANDAKVEANKSIRIPEWDANTHVPQKEHRAGKVLGFDKDGNPTVGEDCEQVKELMKAQEACNTAVKQAGSYAQQAEQSANLAGQHSFDANESMVGAAILADEAKKHALTAEAQLQKVKDEGAKAVATITGLEGKAKQHADNAEASANRAEAAAGSINIKAEEFNKAVCYVGCAVKRVEKQEESVNATVETAKQELTEKAEQTKQEIAGFTDVYTKQETDAALATETHARQEADAKHDAELNAMKVYANSISGGAILMYVDIPPDDGSTEYWKTDPVDFHRYYELNIQSYLGNFTIDWGDGIVESLSYSTMKNPVHRYVNTGRHYILVYGAVSEVTMSGDASTTKDIPAAIFAKISLVLATLESASSINCAFSGFLGGDVFLDLRNCTNMDRAFIGAKMNRVVANTSQKSIYHLFRTGTFDSVVFTEEWFTSGSQPMYAEIRKIVCRNCLRKEITTYFLHYNRNVLEEFYFEAPLLERVTGTGLTYGFSNRPNFRVMGFGLPSLKNGDALFENTNLDKASVLRILNALPDRTGVEPEQDGDGVITFTSNVATAAINNIDAEIQAAIDAARNKNWTVEV